MDSVIDGRIVACTSELALAELLPMPLALRSQTIVELYSGVLDFSDFLSVAEAIPVINLSDDCLGTIMDRLS